MTRGIQQTQSFRQVRPTSTRHRSSGNRQRESCDDLLLPCEQFVEPNTRFVSRHHFALLFLFILVDLDTHILLLLLFICRPRSGARNRRTRRRPDSPPDIVQSEDDEDVELNPHMVQDVFNDNPHMVQDVFNDTNKSLLNPHMAQDVFSMIPTNRS